MKKSSLVVPIIVILLALPAIITGIQHGTVAVAAANTCIPMPPPFYFAGTTGYPTCTSAGLQLMPSSSTYGGVGWHALNYQNSTALVSFNGTYTSNVNGAGVADGFTTMMFVQNGTGTLGYMNNTIPGVSTGAGGLCQFGTQNFGSLLSFPNSTKPFFALQWDPFYGAAPQFNLFVINPGCKLAVSPHPASIGCSIGAAAPAPRDVIGLKTSYSPQINGGTLEASVVDYTASRNCSFTRSLVGDQFNPPSRGNYWAFVEANAGGGFADWTLVSASVKVASATNWVPAGPSSNTLNIPIFSNATAENTALFAGPPTIDAMDVAAVPTTNCVAPNYVLTSTNYCYTSYWQRIIDSGVSSTGTFNFFTSLNAYSDGSCLQAACTLPRLSPGIFRQGFSKTTTSLNPYGATSSQDLYVLRNVYDKLYRYVPVDQTQLLDWMLNQHSIIYPVSAASLGYTPPGGTVTAVRSTLLPDIFWQDGRKVTTWDVAFSYESLMATLAPQLPSSGVLSCPSGPMCSVAGITVLSPSEFDIDLFTTPPTTTQLGDIGSLTIIPGYYWSNLGSTAWASAVAACLSTPCTPLTYSLTPGSPPTPTCSGPGCTCPGPNCIFPASFMSPAPSKAMAGFDPIANGQLIGSGPWSCLNTGTNSRVQIGTLGTGCSSSNTQSPPTAGSFTLTRYGCTLTSCYPPGSVLEQGYFRSSGVLALWIWSGMTGDFTHDFILFNQMSACYQKAPAALTAVFPPTGCVRSQQGIAAAGFTTPAGVNGCPAGGNPCGVPLGMMELDIADEMVGVYWISPPYNWASSPPTGIAPLSSLWLYEGTATLFPASGTNGVGCLPPYPAGGYDC